MKIQKFLLLFFCLLFSAYANKPPVIHSASANPTAITAGMYVSFDVIATDADKDILTYEWDFNDGTKSNKRTVLHVFDFNENVKKTFNVKIKVSDGKEFAEKEIPIEVEPAFLKLKIISPLAEETFSKGGIVSIKVALLDKLLQPIPNYKTYYVTATISGKTFDLEAIGEGIWGADIEIPYKSKNYEYIIIEASAFAEGEPRYTNSAVAIKLQPITLRVEVITEPETLRVGDELNSIALRITYPDGSIVENAKIDAYLGRRKLNFVYTKQQYVASDLKFLIEDERIPLSANIKDAYGNILKDFRRTLKAKRIEKPTEIEKPPIEEEKIPVEKPIEKVEEKLLEQLVVFIQQNIIMVGAGFLFFIVIIIAVLFFLRKRKEVEIVIDEKKLKHRIDAAYIKLSAVIPKQLSPVEKLRRLEARIKKRPLASVKISEKLTSEEEEAVEHLVKLLLPHKDKYNKKELEAAVMAEGYSRKIAKIVAKRIYG